jgi:hypothetical protein
VTTTSRLAPHLVALVLVATACAADGPRAADELHADYDRLLQTHVAGFDVDYAAWASSEADHAALARYVEDLAALDPAGWPHADGLAYWINMYNAVTLRLILDNYPLESIKDLGGFLKKSPWKRELVTVAGRDLTLDQIEHDIIRREFGDPRIHFAVNCASVGCPPLQPRAYRAAELDAQLDHACRQALNHERWVRVEGDEIRVTRIFDWYGEDFDSVRSFIDRYRPSPLPGGKIEFLDYDWSLNQAR